MNTNNDCPAPDVLAAFAGGDLDAAALESAQAHISHCDSCLETVALLTSKASNSGDGEVRHRTLAAAEDQVGPYRLVRRVGEGGMGEVWEAQQVAPVRRTVALKLLKAGMDTRQIVTRFEAERQVLALMQHPSIAQVFDAGITEAGRPYFVMEFVDGVRITTYCDQHAFDVRARLKLFQRVCEAVEHAHRKGVIHRDIKPSNVLVAEQGEQVLPKVIDFGLAKAIEHKEADHSLTELGMLVGTPAYASPEQMGVGAQDVDTRTDVYSLGALLYELLIGVIPHDFDARPASFDLREALRDREPARPSTRLTALGERGSEIAKRRHSDVKLLRRQLRGDLDWVVMKALDKDRERRYASPHELALDIERYLKHEPLQVGPPTAAYRVRKFVRRHRVGTAFAATLAALVVGFFVVTIVQSRRIATERDRATAEAAKANSINAFLQETLGSADPWQTGKDISIREVLANAERKADSDFKDQPLVAAAVKNTIGKTYIGLGQLDSAERLIREALATRRAHLGAEHADIATSLYDLTIVQQHRSDYEPSTANARAALAMNRAVSGDRSAEAAKSLDLLAESLALQGEYDQAETVALEALSEREALFGPQSAEVADSLLTLTKVLANGKGRFDDALPRAQRAYDLYLGLFGRDDLRTATAATSIGATHWFAQRPEQALEYYRQALDVYVRIAGPDHPETASTRENVANALARLQRFDESIPLLEEVLAVRRAKAGEDAAVTARTMGNLAAHQLQAGRLAEARTTFERTLPLSARAYGDDHPDYATVLANYGALLLKSSQLDEAERAFRRAIDIRAAKLGEDHLSTAKTRFDLGTLLLDRGEYAEAEQLLTLSHAARVKQLGADHVQTQAGAEALARLYASWGKPEKTKVLSAADSD